MPLPAKDLSPRARNLLFLSDPRLWPEWPFLPLVRRRPGCEEECGVLFDALGACNLAGHSATVYLVNVFELPPVLTEFFALPKEVFDTPEEVLDSGWTVD